MHTYALESVLDEVVYVVGPALAITLSTSACSAAGPLTAAVLLTVGVLLFTGVRNRRCTPGRNAPGAGRYASRGSACWR
ncbi:hypothetical protein ABZT06_28025 [Streptomyces sp. NPDC005483]|uniref:hypothetical protein n=1 Tax=Streptomyces sp. NPDC005483 TaxID=3154882 RepID=UPI0033BF143C